MYLHRKKIILGKSSKVSYAVPENTLAIYPHNTQQIHSLNRNSYIFTGIHHNFTGVTEDHMCWPCRRPTNCLCPSSSCANARPGKRRQKAFSALEIARVLFCHHPPVLPSPGTGWDSGATAPSISSVTSFCQDSIFLPST